MTKAVVVPFHPGTFAPTKHYRVFEKAWLACWKKWRHLIDKAYIIDHGWDFKGKDKKFKVFKIEKSHWDNMAEVIPKVKEDIIILMDCDTVFYSEIEMERILRDMEKVDLSAIFDGSGGVNLAKKYDFLKPNKNRTERRRIAPYLCFIKRDLMMKTSLDFAPVGGGDFQDSFGKWTGEVLSHNPKIRELEDDRNTLRLNKDGAIEKDTWLDGPGYKWSEPMDEIKRLGYYHIRNFTLGLNLVNGFRDDRATYLHYKRITPFSEAMRCLAWLQALTVRFGTPDQLSRILPVAHDFGATNWGEYVDNFEKYHSWIKDL